MKILLFDIETAPILANVWSLWSEARDMKFVDMDWYVLSWSAKWLDQKKITTKALPDYPNYKKDRTDDSALVSDIWTLLDEADIVIGHNAQKFDVRKLNARFIVNGKNPPSPFKTIDTLKAARAYFKFSSNKLDGLGRILGLGCKVQHEGFQLWKDCMAGKRSAWKIMKKYNEQDVILLEDVYLKLRPYIRNHPNISLDKKNIKSSMCPSCGSTNLHKRGYAYTNIGKYSRLCCQDCGKWSKERFNEMSKSNKPNIIANI